MINTFLDSCTCVCKNISITAAQTEYILTTVPENGVSIQSGITIALVTVIVVLVIIALIIGFKKLRDDDPPIDGETRYY